MVESKINTLEELSKNVEKISEELGKLKLYQNMPFVAVHEIWRKYEENNKEKFFEFCRNEKLFKLWLEDYFEGFSAGRRTAQ